MKRNGTPLQPYSEEMEARIEEIKLRSFRKILGNPNMSVQEMREMNNRKRENTIEVTFLKHTPPKKQEPEQ